MKPTEEQIAACIAEIPFYTDKDAFVSDLALSSIFGETTSSEIDFEIVAFLQKLWDENE